VQFFWELLPESISTLVGGGGNLSQLPGAKGHDNPRVMPHGVTIEVYKTAGHIHNSGLAFNHNNIMEKKGSGLSSRHAASDKAPNDELGRFAQDFCDRNSIKIQNA